MVSLLPVSHRLSLSLSPISFLPRWAQSPKPDLNLWITSLRLQLSALPC